MKNKAAEYLKKSIDFIKNLDKKKRNTYIVIAAISILLTGLAVFILNHKEYVVLYRNLDTKECATIVKRLDEMKVAYKIENESTIYIDKESEPKVKLQLASEGYPKSSLNYDIFTKNIDFMTTDYEKTKYNLFLLQERLQSSIKTLDNVKDAIVTISLPDNSLAVLDKDKISPSASVVLSLTNGATLNEQQIKGVELLVAKSVPGLTGENVSIIDSSGKVLNDHSEDANSASASSRAKAETELSEMISKRISSVLEPLYGKSNLSVGVSVALDYNKKTTETTQYKPVIGNNGIIQSFDQSYEGAGGSGSAAGGTPGTDSNSEIPGYQIPTGGNGQNIKNDVSVKYFVNQIKEQVEKEGAEIKDISVSVLINKTDLTADDTERLAKVVANTSGIAREKVMLMGVEFTATKPGAITGSKPDKLNLLSERFILIYIIAILILALIFIQIRHRRKKKLMLKEMFADEAAAQSKDTLSELSKITEITETKEQKLTREIRDFSIKSPQITAQLLRTMLKGDFD